MKSDKKAGTSVHIALLRGVMPIGRNRVPMADLRKLLVDLGFDRVRTYIASGNAVFRSDELAGAALEALLEREIAQRIGPSLDVMVRNACAWDRLIAANPFPEDAATRQANSSRPCSRERRPRKAPAPSRRCSIYLTNVGSSVMWRGSSSPPRVV